MTEYCGKIKALVDTLRDFGSPLTDQELVINVLSGLNEKFANCFPTISAARPPMTFLQARSLLLQEEVWASNRAQKAINTALLTGSRSAGASHNAPTAGSGSSQYPSSGGHASGATSGSDHPRKCKKQFNRNGSSTSSGGPNAGAPTSTSRGAPTTSWVNPWTGVVQAWPLAQLPSNMSPAGVLGVRPDAAPQQSLAAQHAPAGTLPLALYQTLTGLSLQSSPPSSTDWVFNTDASSHMASNSGMLFSISPSSSQIVVGNGASLPVQCTSSPPSSLLLRDVLISPFLIHNLISVHRLTKDNSVSVEFDPPGFSIKDLHSKAVLLCSESSGDLFPLHAATSPLVVGLHVTIDLWHARLGHPGHPAFTRIMHHLDFDFTPTINILAPRVA